MPRITKLYTRKGDDGTTGLGTGARVRKNCLRIEAYGTVDELNAQIGLVLAAAVAPEIAEPLRRVQNELFHAGAELCVPEADRAQLPGPRIETGHVQMLEELVDRLNGQLPSLKNFVLPGGTAAAAQLHAARTVCRRAERVAVALAEQEPISPEIVKYLNRLSDALFVMARYDNKLAGQEEPVWDSRA